MSKIWVSVQVLPLALAGPANSLWQATPSATDKSFLLFLAPTTTVSELFRHIDERYKKDYLKQSRHNSFYIKKLQDEDGDDLATDFCIADLPRNAKDKLVIRVVPATIDRDFSVPENSSLRPRDFARPKRPADDAFDAPHKRLRRDDSGFETPSYIFRPDHPIRSTERDLADTNSTGRDRSSQPALLPPHNPYGEVVADSEDERVIRRSDDELDEDEDEENQEDISTTLRAPAAPEKSSPEAQGSFKKPALPGSIGKKASSAHARKPSNPVSLPDPFSSQASEEQWRHAESKQGEPDLDQEPWEVPDTDNEQASAELNGRRSSSIMSRHRNIEQLKNRRRSRGETSDLDKSPQPKSGNSERKTNKTYGSVRSKKMSAASRLAFTDSQSQSQHQNNAHRPATPDLDGFEELLTEPMVSRDELARRKSREEQAESASKGEAARQYFLTASAEKAKKHTNPLTTSEAAFHIPRPNLSAQATLTPSNNDTVANGSPTPASRSIHSKSLSERRTSSVSFVTPNDSTKAQPSAPGPSTGSTRELRNLRPLLSSSIQPKTVAGPSSSAASSMPNGSFSTPAARRMRSARKVTKQVPSNVPLLVSDVLDAPDPSSSTKRAPACLRCKAIKMSCSATRDGLYPCDRCLRSPSHPKCTPPQGWDGTPAPSSQKQSLSAARKRKGKAPEHTPRAGTLENLRINPDTPIDPGNISDREDDPTPAPRRGLNGSMKNKSSLSNLTKKGGTGTTLKPLTNSSTNITSNRMSSEAVNGIEKTQLSLNKDVPPSLADAFKTPPPDELPQTADKIAEETAISQEDETSGSEGDIESIAPEEPILSNSKDTINQSNGNASPTVEQGDDTTSEDEEDESDEEDEDDGADEDGRKGEVEAEENDDEENDDDEDEDDEDDDDDDDDVSSYSDGDRYTESPKKAPSKARVVTKTPTPPQSFPFPSSQPSQHTDSSKASTSRKSTSPPDTRKLPSPPSNAIVSSATAAPKPSTRKAVSGSDSDSSSSSSSSSAGSSSDGRGNLAMGQKGYAGGLASSSMARGGAKNSRFGSVKSFISSTFGFSSSQHDSGGRSEWYDVPNSPEPELPGNAA